MKGFTLIELILIVSLITILTGVSSPFLSSFILRDNWHVTTDKVSSELWKAQSYSMEGKSIGGNVVWGVCVTGGVFRLFNGSCLSPNYKEDFSIPNGISVTGLTSITFGNLRGEPSAATTINISSSLGSSSIVLNNAGMIDSN